MPTMRRLGVSRTGWSISVPDTCFRALRIAIALRVSTVVAPAFGGILQMLISPPYGKINKKQKQNPNKQEGHMLNKWALSFFHLPSHNYFSSELLNKNAIF